MNTYIERARRGEDGEKALLEEEMLASEREEIRAIEHLDGFVEKAA